jgi:hypothetical protein
MASSPSGVRGQASTGRSQYSSTATADRAVLVGITQVKRLAHAVVGGPVEANAGLVYTPEGVGQCRPGGVQNRHVVQPRRAWWRWGTPATFPRIQPDVVVVPARRHKRRLGAETLHEGKPQHVDVKGQRAFEVGDFQVHMPDAGTGIDGGNSGHGGKK